MKALKNTLLPTVSKASKDCSASVNTPRPVIKLEAVTTAERQKLRISSYQYLLP